MAKMCINYLPLVSLAVVFCSLRVQAILRIDYSPKPVVLDQPVNISCSFDTAPTEMNFNRGGTFFCGVFNSRSMCYSDTCTARCTNNGTLIRVLIDGVTAKDLSAWNCGPFIGSERSNNIELATAVFSAAPISVSVEEVTAREIHFTWTAAPSGGPYTRFVVTYSSFGAKKNSSVTTDDTWVTVTDLSPGTVYNLWVQAENTFGLSPPYPPDCPYQVQTLKESSVEASTNSTNLEFVVGIALAAFGVILILASGVCLAMTHRKTVAQQISDSPEELQDVGCVPHPRENYERLGDLDKPNRYDKLLDYQIRNKSQIYHIYEEPENGNQTESN